MILSSKFNKTCQIITFVIFILLQKTLVIKANNGYDLWLKQTKISSPVKLKEYGFIKSIYLPTIASNEIGIKAKDILKSGLKNMLGKTIFESKNINSATIVYEIQANNNKINEEGYEIIVNNKKIEIKAKTSKGLLYGTFFLLSKIQTQASISDFNIIDSPKIKWRMLNHWDNLDRTVERGYAGFSIFNWHELPENLDQQYTHYALANASVGINAIVLTNVNANALILRPDYLEKVGALAKIFRPFGIKVFNTARFSAPIELGKLTTANPKDLEIQQWWKNKIDEIYSQIPDFGGFLIKANSEGQPGPQQYGCTHAQGANMLAKPLQKYGGVVFWRAFVYDAENKEDRFTQAYHEFKPLDGQFESNVIVQIKNGPIDFQPREPVHPLFGQMPKTSQAIEFQITKEYLGQGTHWVNLLPMYTEILASKINDKTLSINLIEQKNSAMAGVANIGTAKNWTGHFMGQADWYGFGRLAWNPQLNTESIYLDWINRTFLNLKNKDKALILSNMLKSYETCVNYMAPFGLHHVMAEGHHYGPGPWVANLARPDWTATYYHRADSLGIGYDRSQTGNNALKLYSNNYAQLFNDKETCPESFLLWFHQVPWKYKLANGQIFWDAFCQKYQLGVSSVKQMKENWQNLNGKVDLEIYKSVLNHLQIQEKEAEWWQNASLSYFQSISKLPFAQGITKPPYTLEYYKNLSYPMAPGLKPKW